MRITWFGGTVFRLYVGGEIIVTDGHLSDDVEVLAAADHLVDLSGGMPGIEMSVSDAPHKRRKSLLEEPEVGGVSLTARDGAALIVRDMGEGDLIVVTRPLQWGRFADAGVVVLALGAETALRVAQDLFEAARPRLLILAVDDLNDAQFAHLAEICGDCAVQVLEPGLALEA